MPLLHIAANYAINLIKTVEIKMTYTLNKFRKENTTPAPLYPIDGVIIIASQFMHNEWWYVINNSWTPESAILF
jgi:hypothetical protein